MNRALILLALCLPAHAALRPGTGGTTPKPTTPPPTNPTPALPTGGGSPTLICERYPALCVQ